MTILHYKKTLASVFFVFILLMIFTFINKDDELHPDIPAFLELSAPVPATDGHAVLYALDAPLGSDVVTLGHNAIKAFKLNKDVNGFEFENAISADIQTPCLDDIALCFKSIKDNTLQNNPKSEVEKEIQRRMNMIRATPALGNVFEPNINEPMPNYRFYFMVQNNEFMKLIETFISGDTQTPLLFLYNDTEQLRHNNQFSTDLVSKMVNTKLIENNLTLITLFSKNNTNAKLIEEMHFTEIDLKPAFSREYHTSFNLMTDLVNNENNAGLFNKKSSIGEIISIKLFFKENQTHNNYYKHITYQYWEEDNDFDEYSNRDFNSIPSFEPSILNYIGDILSAVATPAYYDYQLKPLANACKITQYNKSIDPNHQAKTLLTNEQCNLITIKINKGSRHAQE